MDELLKLPLRVPLRTAAAALMVGQNEAYRLAAAGEDVDGCPVKRLGRTWIVNRADLFRALGLDPAMVRPPDADTRGAA